MLIKTVLHHIREKHVVREKEDRGTCSQRKGRWGNMWSERRKMGEHVDREQEDGGTCGQRVGRFGNMW